MEIISELINSYTTGEVLELKNMNLYELPDLPDYITKLDISGNYITKLLNLPKNLTHLDASSNRLREVILPDNICVVNLTYNQLTEINLPSGLKQLSLAYNEFLECPKFGDNLADLDISNNKLSHINVLPVKLKTLVCSNNKIQKIETLPSTIELLDCSTNELSELPVLPDTLTSFDCSNNKLKTIPELPLRLNILDCERNELETLPRFGKDLKFINYENNQLITQPKLSARFGTFKFSDETDQQIDDRSSFHLEILPDCLDYQLHKEVRSSAFISNPNNVILKIYDDYYGIPRKTLLELASKRENVYKELETGYNYIKIIMIKLVSLIDFEKFTLNDYSIYVISRTQDYAIFQNTLTPKTTYWEKMVVHPYTVKDFVETQF